MKRLPVDTYTVVMANGDVARIRVPQMIAGPLDLVAKRPHSLWFMHVKKGERVYAFRSGDRVHIDGPAVVLVHGSEFYHVPAEPLTDADASTFYREHGPDSVVKAWQ